MTCTDSCPCKGAAPRALTDEWLAYELYRIAMYGDRGNGDGTLQRIRAVLAAATPVQQDAPSRVCADTLAGCAPECGPHNRCHAAGVNACPTPDWLVLAQQCGGTVYRHRSDPHKPAVAFGDESWARFTEALSKTTAGVDTVTLPRDPTEGMVEALIEGSGDRVDTISLGRFRRAYTALLKHVDGVDLPDGAKHG